MYQYFLRKLDSVLRFCSGVFGPLQFTVYMLTASNLVSYSWKALSWITFPYDNDILYQHRPFCISSFEFQGRKSINGSLLENVAIHSGSRHFLQSWVKLNVVFPFSKRTLPAVLTEIPHILLNFRSFLLHIELITETTSISILMAQNR